MNKPTKKKKRANRGSPAAPLVDPEKSFDNDELMLMVKGFLDIKKEFLQEVETYNDLVSKFNDEVMEMQEALDSQHKDVSEELSKLQQQAECIALELDKKDADLGSIWHDWRQNVTELPDTDCNGCWDEITMRVLLRECPELAIEPKLEAEQAIEQRIAELTDSLEKLRKSRVLGW